MATCMVVLVAAVVAGTSPGAASPPTAPGARSCPAEWAEATLANRRPVPFDPMTFRAPALNIDLGRIRERRWWAEALVSAVAAAGWIAADQTVPAADFAESLMRRPELNFSLPFAPEGAEGTWRVRVQVKMKSARPSLGVIVTW